MPLMRSALPFVAVLAGLLGAACDRRPASDLRPIATVKDIMLSIIDPSADFVWEAVATIVTPAGTEERMPKNDEEWLHVRKHAIHLLEASNLLVVEGRKVGRPGERSENPKIELEPEEMDALIAKDRPTWVARAHALQDAVAVALRAIEAKDPPALTEAGEGIEAACENCHLTYWYPGQGPPPPPADARP